jgi:probable rRNA maturation factor
LGCDGAELSLWLCDDETIRGLHAEYFGIDTPTNVISFAQNEGEFAQIDPDMLGDVVVSVQTAARDASEAGGQLDDEVSFLIIHGILHLLGYDHEGDRVGDAPEMEAKEEELYRLVREIEG